MPASEARILANRRNAALSTGPKTPEGKEASRANSLKHGLTGKGIVMPEGDAAEVERRADAYWVETNATGEIGALLVRRAAIHSVRMERAADQQSVAMTRRIRQVEADFVAPEGADSAEAARLRSEAVRFAHARPVARGDPVPQVRERGGTVFLPMPQGVAEARPRGAGRSRGRVGTIGSRRRWVRFWRRRKPPGTKMRISMRCTRN